MGRTGVIDLGGEQLIKVPRVVPVGIVSGRRNGVAKDPQEPSPGDAAANAEGLTASPDGIAAAAPPKIGRQLPRSRAYRIRGFERVHADRYTRVGGDAALRG